MGRLCNISPSAVRDLSLGNEFVMFSGRFAGRSFEITLPIESIRAIYCRDSGQGLAFEDEDFAAAESLVTEQETSVLNPEIAAEETAVKDGDAEKKAPTCGWSSHFCDQSTGCKSVYWKALTISFALQTPALQPPRPLLVRSLLPLIDRPHHSQKSLLFVVP